MAFAAGLAISAAGASAGPLQPDIWIGCHQDLGPSFQCATVHVPLSYDGSAGGTVSIALVRIPASDPARRIGSLFVNPGGPGGSGVDFVLYAGPYLFTGEVRATFDIVGFDPRGVARSTPADCFHTTSQWAPMMPPFPYPITAAEEIQAQAFDHFVDDACAQRGGRILEHMATGNAARDLDLLRQAVGDDQLSYYGLSYGSFLGQVYANLFPDKVRALVIDGVLDPVAWTTGAPGEENLPLANRLRMDTALQRELEEFFRLCDAGGAACAFSGGAAQRFAALAARLASGPIRIVDPRCVRAGCTTLVPFTYADLVIDTLYSMYSSFGWTDLAGLLAYLEAGAGPASLGAVVATLHESVGLMADRGFPRYVNSLESWPAVACTDSDNPHSYAVWSALAAAEDQQPGYFGRAVTWSTSGCADWPFHDAARYQGPFTNSTTNPVLVIGNLFDGITRYEGAVTAHQLLPNSSLLTVQGWGHTSLFLSRCVDQKVEQYLVGGVTPAPGTLCGQDYVPFAPPPAASAGGGSGFSVPGTQQLRAELFRQTAPTIAR